MGRLLAAVTLGLWLLGASQANADDRCSDILRDGTKRTVAFKESIYYRHVLYARFATTTYEGSKRETMAGLSVPIGEAVMGSANYSEGAFKQKQQQIEQSLNTDETLAHSIDYALASGDKEIIDAWSGCLNDTRLDITSSARTPEEARVTLQWHQGEVDLPVIKLLQAVPVPDGATVIQGKECLKKGTKFRTCVVTIKLPAAATTWEPAFSTTGGLVQAFVPPRTVIREERLAHQVVPTGCMGPAPGPPGYVATSVWWDNWGAPGAKCETRLITDAPPSSRKSASRTVYLPDALVKDGWRFDPDTAKAPSHSEYGGGCWDGDVIVSPNAFTYGVTSVTTRKNTDAVCTVMPTIERTRMVIRAATVDELKVPN